MGVYLGSPGAEGFLCVRRWARGPQCGSWLWLCPCRTLSVLGGSPAPPCPGPRGSPRCAQRGRACPAPPRLRQQPWASRHRSGSSPAFPTCGAPARGEPHRGTEPVSWGRCSSSGISPGAGCARAWGAWVPCSGGLPGDPTFGAVPWRPPRGSFGTGPCCGWLPGDPTFSTGPCRGWLPGRGASRLRFPGGSAVPSRPVPSPPRGSGAVPARLSCCAPDVPLAPERGRTGQHLSGPVPSVPCVTRSPCPQIPAASCPRSHCPCIVVVPLSPHSHGSAFRYPDAVSFPDPFVPNPHIPVSPRAPIPLCPLPGVRGDRGRAASRYRGRFPVLRWAGKRPGWGGGVPPVPAGSRRCGAARYRQGAPPPPPGRVKAAGAAPAPGGMARGALRLLCCAAALLAAAEQRPTELSPAVVAVLSLAVCVLLAAVAALLVRRARRGTPPFQHLDEVPMSKVTEGSPVPTPS
ncbi:uncharacterized protein LOC141725368 isoform X2 [Zonotrichia albicollis]|uniref:uncharacterized protein LOC141725368 isoform X2 n=1 Tax=Zonotrichia albicollis TaxID=44394 RepID=UPI003D80FDAA